MGSAVAVVAASLAAFGSTPSTNLAIVVRADATATPRTYTLRCRPAGGTLPHPGAACAKLARTTHPFAPVPPRTACAMVYAGPEVATVTGTYGDHRVRAAFRRTDSCQTARWDRVAFLFPIATRAP